VDNLYNHIETAEQFAATQAQVPSVDHSSQAAIGLDMAQRAAATPAPEPVKQMPPIVPVAN
jgi:hypothetical protein